MIFSWQTATYMYDSLSDSMMGHTSSCLHLAGHLHMTYHFTDCKVAPYVEVLVT